MPPTNTPNIQSDPNNPDNSKNPTENQATKEEDKTVFKLPKKFMPHPSVRRTLKLLSIVLTIMAVSYGVWFAIKHL